MGSRSLIVSMKKIIFWMWPPYEARAANRYILKQQEEKGEEAYRKNIIDSLKLALTEPSNYADYLSLAKDLRQVELERKKTIESKASSFLQGVGLAVPIVSLILVLIGNNLQAVSLGVIISIVLYSLTFILLIMSAIYAIKVRKNQTLYSLCADQCTEVLRTENNKTQTQIANAIADCKMNETRLCIMTNNLSVAEGLFLRAIVLLMVASVFLMLIKFCQLYQYMPPTALNYQAQTVVSERRSAYSKKQCQPACGRRVRGSDKCKRSGKPNFQIKNKVFEVNSPITQNAKSISELANSFSKLRNRSENRKPFPPPSADKNCAEDDVCLMR